MATTNGTTKTFTGTLARSNEHGIQLSETGSWLNFSRFTPRPELPPLGTTVRIVLDSRGFVRTVEPVNPPDAEQQGVLPLAPPRDSVTDHIAQSTALQAAVRRHANRLEATDDEILTTAQRFLAWIEAS
jgi:hypothetical protein